MNKMELSACKPRQASEVSKISEAFFLKLTLLIFGEVLYNCSIRANT